eukprot:4987219-Amphidinium_carterae.1
MPSSIFARFTNGGKFDDTSKRAGNPSTGVISHHSPPQKNSRLPESIESLYSNKQCHQGENKTILGAAVPRIHLYMRQPKQSRSF